MNKREDVFKHESALVMDTSRRYSPRLYAPGLIGDAKTVKKLPFFRGVYESMTHIVNKGDAKFERTFLPEVRYFALDFDAMDKMLGCDSNRIEMGIQDTLRGPDMRMERIGRMFGVDFGR